MIKELFWFLVILAVDLIAFASLIYFLFNSTYSEFNHPFHAFITLVSSGLGNFIYPESSLNASEYLIAIIITIFLLITNIVLMNLLIAILTNIYSLIND